MDGPLRMFEGCLFRLLFADGRRSGCFDRGVGQAPPFGPRPGVPERNNLAGSDPGVDQPVSATPVDLRVFWFATPTGTESPDQAIW